MPTQVIDVRDPAVWLVAAAADALTGTFNAVGPTVPFGEWVRLCRATSGNDGPVRHVPAAALLDQKVAQWAGDDSLAMWLVEPRAGLADRRVREHDRLDLAQLGVP